MPFASFVVGGGGQYHRIDHAKVQSAVFSIETVESDESALLNDNHGDSDEEQHREHKHHQLGFISRHRTLAFMRKSAQEVEVNINLCIRKMDDTTFVLEVSNRATVSELKGAVQKKFESSGAGQCQISWPHVWGHFCLSFKNQKLVDESASLHQLGIRQSDELCFVRHVASRTSTRCQKRGFFNGLRKKQGLPT